MYAFVKDPGHGWLGVPLAELADLDIVHSLSKYSYFDRPRRVVWLEEDLDLSRYLQARFPGLRAADPRLTTFWADVVTTVLQRDAPIRDLPSVASICNDVWCADWDSDQDEVILHDGFAAGRLMAVNRALVANSPGIQTWSKPKD